MELIISSQVFTSSNEEPPEGLLHVKLYRKYSAELKGFNRAEMSVLQCFWHEAQCI